VTSDVDPWSTPDGLLGIEVAATALEEVSALSLPTVAARPKTIKILRRLVLGGWETRGSSSSRSAGGSPKRKLA
jgi:hypothetical protein